MRSLNLTLFTALFFLVAALVAASPSQHVRHRAIAARQPKVQPKRRSNSGRCKASSALSNSTVVATSTTDNLAVSTDTEVTTKTQEMATTHTTHVQDPSPTTTTSTHKQDTTTTHKADTTTTHKADTTTKAATTTKKATTTHETTTTKSSSGSSSGYYAGTNSGDATWYNTGLDACGVTDSDSSSFIAAVSIPLFDNYPGYAGGNPNNNPVCGKQVRATYQGKSVTVTISDRCAACAPEDLDFSPLAFQELADPSIGRLHGMTWEWI